MHHEHIWACSRLSDRMTLCTAPIGRWRPAITFDVDAWWLWWRVSKVEITMRSPRSTHLLQYIACQLYLQTKPIGTEPIFQSMLKWKPHQSLKKETNFVFVRKRGGEGFKTCLLDSQRDPIILSLTYYSAFLSFQKGYGWICSYPSSL